MQEPLDGLIRNTDCDLEGHLTQIEKLNDRHEVVRITILLIGLRFAINSYRAVCFLLVENDEPRRLKEFVVILPPIIRQLIDLWCSLIYILDDFAARVDEFEYCAWLEVRDHITKMKKRFGPAPDRQVWYENMEELQAILEKQVPDDLRADPSKIGYWPTPSKITKRKTKSGDFLKYIHSNFYDDTSAEAHLKPGGLLAAGSFLLSDRVSDEIRKQIETRTYHEYKARRFCRTVVALLGIITEVDAIMLHKNKEQCAKVWTLLAGYDPEAKEVYEMRYKTLLS